MFSSSLSLYIGEITTGNSRPFDLCIVEILIECWSSDTLKFILSDFFFQCERYDLIVSSLLSRNSKTSSIKAIK